MNKNFLFITIALSLNLALAEGVTDFKKDFVPSCVASGNAQLSCECADNRLKKELAPEAWEAWEALVTDIGRKSTTTNQEATTFDPKKEMEEEAEATLRIENLDTFIESTEAGAQIKKIAADCGITE